MADLGYDRSTDVLVVGYGGAGAVAAITAHDLGAEVLVLEKTDEGGGNTKVSGGGILTPRDLEGAAKYLLSLLGDEVGTEMINAYVSYSSEVEAWIRSLGGEVEPHPVGAEFPSLPSATSMARLRVKGPGTPSQNLWRCLHEAAHRRGIKALTRTVAKLLIVEGGRVVGVLAENEDGSLRIRARRAVILTCGGFEYDGSLKASFLVGGPYFAFGTPANTGDGVRMAQKVGAFLWRMKAVAAPIGYKFPEFPWAIASAFVISPSVDPPPSYSFIYADRHGRRFMDESGVEFHLVGEVLSYFDPVGLDYPRTPSSVIFDELARKAGPVARSGIGLNRGRYEWSRDNSVEVDRGWITKGSNIRELAEKINMPPDSLADTITEYNEACAQRQADKFGRSPATLTPIDSPPFYAILIWPCLVSTHGGPRRNSRGQIIDALGVPIPRLYGAGELGSLWGSVYQGGGMLAECLAFGRIAGENAAREEPSP